MTKKFGFTLAEVLITLGIIGVVAAMTIPTLVANYQERTYNTAATTFERKLGEALKVMNSQSALAGYATTEDFVQELSKHFKITKTCANDKLTECFGEEVFWGSGTATPEAVDMNTIKTSKNFGQNDWQQTNVVGVQFASGVSALIAYNKDATQDPYSNQTVNILGSSDGKKGSVSLGTDALAILYDTNGLKSPNQSSKDLRSINIAKLGKGCFSEANGVCIAIQPQVPTPHFWNSCSDSGSSSDPEDKEVMAKYGITKCCPDKTCRKNSANWFSGDGDYWTGAVKLCGGIDKMATPDDLLKIGYYIYDTDNLKTGENSYTYDLILNTSKASAIGIPAPISVWTNEEISASTRRYRAFTDNFSAYVNGSAYSSTQIAVCVDR